MSTSADLESPGGTATAGSDPDDVAGPDQPRVVLVTGAARGIGAAVALGFAGQGCAVVLVDICADIAGLRYPLSTPADLDASAAACREAGAAAALSLQVDVRSQAELDAAVAETMAGFGRLDVVVAAAGVMGGGAVAWRISDETWDVNLAVNLTGVWRTARAAIPAMLRAPEPRSGRFVAIASAAGLRGNPTIADYGAAKHGVIGLVKSMAVELGPHGITANAVAPGSTRTAILEASAALYGLGSSDEFSVHHHIGRNLEPEEIAAGVIWLAAPERSATTGIVLPIDGGMTI